MNRVSIAPTSVYRILPLVLAVAAALIWATVAHAQIIQDDQYDTPAAPSGPAAGLSVTVLGDTDGVVNEGDLLVIEGNFSVSGGSSAVLQDSDGTQGTFVDGENSEITEGSIEIAVTGEPANVNGGNGVLNTEGLFVVATTGVSAGDGSSPTAVSGSEGSSAGDSIVNTVSGVLPDTGGPALLAAIGVFAASGTGLMLLRRRINGGSQ